MQSSILVLESQGHWVSLTWVSVESCLLHRKALRSCPFSEPAWKEYRSYWVIKACQHLGYAAWFNPIMWMEPVIALMKSTLVWKEPWMIFFVHFLFTCNVLLMPLPYNTAACFIEKWEISHYFFKRRAGEPEKQRNRREERQKERSTIIWRKLHLNTVTETYWFSGTDFLD